MRALFASLVVLFVIAMSFANTAYANFRRIFRGPNMPQQIFENDSWRCTRTVRRAIKKARADWGWFYFNCYEGVVWQVLTTTTSAIGQRPDTFITRNLGLFDLEGSSITLSFRGDHGIQIYDGQEIGGYVDRYPRWERVPGRLAGDNPYPLTTSDLMIAPNVVPPKEVGSRQYFLIQMRLVDPEESVVEPDGGEE